MAATTAPAATAAATAGEGAKHTTARPEESIIPTTALGRSSLGDHTSLPVGLTSLVHSQRAWCTVNETGTRSTSLVHSQRAWCTVNEHGTCSTSLVHVQRTWYTVNEPDRRSTSSPTHPKTYGLLNLSEVNMFLRQLVP